MGPAAGHLDPVATALQDETGMIDVAKSNGQGPRATQEQVRGRRDLIFKAAERIFHDKGYDATSIQDVADAVGILKGSLYYYIDSKEDLLFGVIEDLHRESLQRIKEWETLEGDALVKLRAFIHAHVATNARSVMAMGVFFRDFRSLSPERQALIVAERDFYDHFVRKLIRQGKREGVIAADVDPKLTSMAILGMMNWLSQWYRAEGPATPERIAREMANLALGGLASAGVARGDRGEIGAAGAPSARRQAS